MLLALGLASVPATFFVARPSATFSVPPIEIGRFFISSDGAGLKTPFNVCTPALFEWCVKSSNFCKRSHITET